MTRREFAAIFGALPLFGAGNEPAYAEIRKLLAGRKLFLVPFSHVDWAWVNSRAWMVRRHATVLAEVLDILKSNPDFRFYLEQWNEQMEPFLHRKPERVAELRRAMQQGSVEACGGVANQHPGWMEPESLIRDMVMGRRLFQDLAPGLNLDVMIHVDVTPGSSQMPQILQKAGYHFYRIHRPDQALNAEGVPLHFIWKGLDGTELLTSRGMGCGFYQADIPDDFASDWPRTVENLYKFEISRQLAPQADLPVWLPIGCDDTRPLRFWRPVPKDGRRTEHLMPIPELIQEWNRREMSHMIFATPIEVFRELEKRRDSLPSHNGILDATMWTYWYGLNGNSGLRLWRTRTDQNLISAESFWSCAAALGEAYPHEEFRQLWRELLATYSHAQMWLFEDDYSAQFDRLKRTYLGSKELLDRAVHKLAGRIQVKENRSTVLIFNDLPWERTDVVQIWVELQDVGATNVEVRDVRDKIVPHQVVDVNWYELPENARTIRELTLLVRPRVPAAGYTGLYVNSVPGAIEVPESEPKSNQLNAGFATLEFSTNGVDAVVHKETGARYRGLGNVQYNEINETTSYHYGPVTKALRWTDAKLESVIQAPLRSSFTMSGKLGPHFARITGYVFPHAQRITLDATIVSTGGAGHFMTIVGLPEPGRFSADVHFGVEDRDVTRIKYVGEERLRKNVFYGAHWASYSAKRYGLALIGATGEKGYQVFPEENALGHFLLMTNPPAFKNWERFVTKAREGAGRHQFDYQFLLHSGDWKSGDVVRRSLEARFPLRPVLLTQQRLPGERDLPEEKSFLKVGGPHVQISAFHREGEQYMIRVFESFGAKTSASLELPFRAASVEEIDFNGNRRARAISLNGSSVQFDIGAWEIVTLAIRD